eukprot:GEMP01009946.1.p1 GENE.GEMP01009946.1~~GEMP01009946.1.p1  ORF type:complete len:351 (-),score=70.65 GEMP01009946.1:1007-2059(-)
MTHVAIQSVVFLGTCSALPVPGKRNVSSMALTLTNGSIIMVDCGEGTQHHVKVCTLTKSSKIDAIFLTHLHGDHCFGIFGLLFSMQMEGRKNMIYIVGPEGVKDLVMGVLRHSGGWHADNYPLEFVEIPNARHEKNSPVCLGNLSFGLTVTAVPLMHSLTCWGYVFQEDDKPGKLDINKAVELGVPKGPLLKKLKEGLAVETPGGITVEHNQVVGVPTRGRKVAVLQDTCDSSYAVETCRDADLIIHEATFEKALKTEAIEKAHSTSEMAGKFATQCNAKILALTHFSSRYVENSKVEGDPALILKVEAEEVFSGPVILAKDFMALDSKFIPLAGLHVTRNPWHRDDAPM